MLHGRPWSVLPVYVVEHSDALFVTYLPEGTPFGFPPGTWPTADGLHPWARFTQWRGHGVLMLHKPGDAFAVWHFWKGPDRRFDTWYLNIQEPFRMTARGFDTCDLELDIPVAPDGTWAFKDWDLVAQHVGEGRFTAEEADAIYAEGVRLGQRLDREGAWWDPVWADWTPPTEWHSPAMPEGWDDESTY